MLEKGAFIAACYEITEKKSVPEACQMYIKLLMWFLEDKLQ